MGAAPPNIWPILLNLSPNILAIGGQDFGREAPKFRAEGAILENFSDFSKKIFPKNAIKSKNCGINGLEKIFVFFWKIVS